MGPRREAGALPRPRTRGTAVREHGAYFNTATVGLVAAQLAPAVEGQNVVIGEREHSSNHYPWRLLAETGYDVRQVPFRNGGLEPAPRRSRHRVGRVQRFTPINAGWKAGRVPFERFFGPVMDLSETASRFDNSVSWIAAVGNEAALSVFDEFGADAIWARNLELATLLRASLAEIGRRPVDRPEANRSTIVSVPLGAAEPAPLLAELKQRAVVCSARDGNLRLAVHFDNHEDDIARVVHALSEI